VIGTRAMLKALLIALLEPTAKLRELEATGDFTSRLALLEELKDALVAVLVGFVLYQIGSGPDDAAAATTTLTPTADATVDQSAPTTKLGTKQQLVVDGSPMNQSFLLFDLKTVKAPISSATLRVHVDNIANGGSSSGGVLASSSNVTWSEKSVTWNARPTIDGAPIATIGAVTQNAWVTVDVTAFVNARAGGKVTLALTSGNTDGAYYDSRETTSTSPQLVVTTASRLWASRSMCSAAVRMRSVAFSVPWTMASSSPVTRTICAPLNPVVCTVAISCLVCSIAAWIASSSAFICLASANSRLKASI